MDKDFFEDSAREEGLLDEQPEVEETDEVEETEIDEIDEGTQEVSSPDLEGVNQDETPDTVTIDGQEYSMDEVRSGMLRQSDYTRKTQELAREKERLEQADFLNSYFASNPHILENIRHMEEVPAEVRDSTYGMHPLEQKIMNIEQEMQLSKLEQTINGLKDKYEDFDEMKILEKATELGVHDLEFVYKATREIPDEKQLLAKAKAELQAEIAQNKGMTKTLITGEGTQTTQEVASLSPLEMKIAQSLGVSPEDYLKNK